MPPAAFLHPQNAPKSSWIKGATSKGGEKEGRGIEEKERRREGKGGTNWT